MPPRADTHTKIIQITKTIYYIEEKKQWMQIRLKLQKQ